MRCNNCGSEVTKSSKFCTQCGNKVETKKVCCSNCGKEILDGASFCMNCGKKVISSNAPNTEDDGKAYIYLIVAYLFCFTLI